MWSECGEVNQGGNRQIPRQVYIRGMKIILLVLLALDMLAVVGVMLAGMFGLTAPDHDPHKSNRLMRWRVTLQAIAVGLVVALLLVG
jgi:hypothetical protein